ncbi:MAG: PhzF family phenazine biosynthesis protein [Bacteroidota bacterium]
MSRLHRYVAFSSDPAGGNPAGVWIGDTLPPEVEMQRIAAEVGYSETAFVAPSDGLDRAVRYFSPKVEVTFCGHATIATGAALGAASGAGTYRLATAAGLVPVTVRSAGALWEASFTTVDPMCKHPPSRLIFEALSALQWKPDDLDASIPPALAYAGAWHLVLAARTADRLRTLDYDIEHLVTLMRQEGFVTAQLVWREHEGLFHSRNPFPVGGVVEDPATGAAAAALGGYLRDTGLVPAPFELTIRQGDAMGRPSRLGVRVPAKGGVVVTGTSVLV